MSDRPRSLTADQALWVLRALWTLLLLAHVVAALMLKRRVVADATAIQGVPYIGIGLGLTVAALTLGGFFRTQQYKAHWRGDAVTPTGYLWGNVPILVMLGFGALSTLMGLYIGHAARGWWSLDALALVLLAMNYPNGKAMQPTPPRLGQKEPSP